MIEWNDDHTYIIAEAGVNHNGDVNIAKKLCLAAKEAGADGKISNVDYREYNYKISQAS